MKLNLNKYVIAFDLVINIIIVYVIRGAAETIPSPEEAVALLGIVNAVTTLVHGAASRIHINIKNFFIIQEGDYRPHIYYTTIKLFIISLLVVI